MEPSRPRPPRPRPPHDTREDPALELRRSRDTVEIPRAWLAPLAGAVIVVLLLVAYLLGKEAGRREGEPVPVVPRSAASDVVQTPQPPPATPAPEVIPGVTYQPPTPLTPTVSGGATRPDVRVPTSSSPPADDPRAPAVAAYFSEIEAYERQAKYWSNPQELAMSLVGQGAQGDTSGLRRLLDTQRTAQVQIESMSVPSECQEHHRRTLSILRRAGEMLAEVERGMASGNLEGLLALSGQARQLETETREVDALAKQLKARYGVAGS